MLEWLIDIDRDIFLILNGWGGSSWNYFWLLMSEKWVGAPLLLLFFYAIVKFWGYKKALLTLLCIGVLIACTDQLANFFKWGVARPRPCYAANLEGLVQLVKNSCGGPYGFFSAHAANSMAVALFMSRLLKERWSWFVFPAVVMALLVGYSRIYIGVHYPLDVLFGFGIGALLAYIMAHICSRLITNNHV